MTSLSYKAALCGDFHGALHSLAEPLVPLLIIHDEARSRRGTFQTGESDGGILQAYLIGG